MSRRVTVILISLVSILAVVAVYFGLYGRESSEINVRTNAASGSATLTSQAEWEAGTTTNIDTATTPGSMDLDDKSESTYLLSDFYGTNPENFSTCATSSMSTAFDADLMTGMNAAIWEGTCDPDPWIKINLGESKYFGTVYSKSQVINISYTNNGVDYTFFGECVDCDDTNVVDWNMTSHPSAQNIKIEGAGWRIWEVYFTTNAVATHTSSSTQLDAGDHDSVEWTTFVPDDSIPANTSIEYRFRTSDDHATWGDWTTSTASAASIDISTLLGATDNAKRYLQVESTLANTDGVSTPTISAYTANYDYSDAPAETCSDGIQNQDETGVDCGGTICDACPTCSDGIQNGDETGVDCGGSCPACPTCSDGIQNGDETGVDCGGSCDACDEPLVCNNNGIQDNGETGVDCGGGGCDECEDTCNNGIKDNGEQFIDCGGPCPACECRVRIFPKNCPEGQNNRLVCPEGPGLFLAILPGYSWDYSVTTRTQKGELRDDVFYSWGWAGGGGYYDWSLTPSEGIGSSAIVRVGSNWQPPEGIGVADGAYVAASCGGSDVSYFYTKVGGDEDDDETCNLSILPEESTLYLKKGYDRETFTAQTKDENGEIIADKSISWSASGGGDLESSNNTTTYQAKETGSYSITATANGCGSATANITTKSEDEWCETHDCGGGPLCIGPWCINIDPEIVEVAGSTSTAALGLGALIASALILLEGLAKVLTMIKPSQILAYLIKGRDRKHARGIVYDSSCGIGVPLAKILLFRSRDQKLIRVATSGSDGRFALETPPGEEYFIQVKKEGYEVLSGSSARMLSTSLAYDNNYTGEMFTSSDSEMLFEKAIPLTTNTDSLKLALSSRTLEHFNKILRVLNVPILLFGFLMSIVAILNTQSPYNITIISIYLLIFIYYGVRLLILDGRSFGLVVNQANGSGVDLAIVRAISETKGKLTRTTVSNEKGRYTLVLPKGFYKIIGAKPELRQVGPVAARVKSSLKPQKTKIVMGEVRLDSQYNGGSDTVDTTVTKPDWQPTPTNQIPTPEIPTTPEPQLPPVTESLPSQTPATVSGSNLNTVSGTKPKQPFTPSSSIFRQPPTPKPTSYTSQGRTFSDSGEIIENYSGEIKEIGKENNRQQTSENNTDHDIPNWKFT